MSRAPRRTLALLAPVLATAVTCATPTVAGARRLAESPEAPTQEPARALHGGGRCELSLQADPGTPVAPGESVTLTGHMSCPEPADAEGRPVSIFAHPRKAALEEAATVTTGADGSFEVSEPVTTRTVFIARGFRARRARAVVEVGAAVTLAGPSAAAAALSTRGRYRHGARAPRLTLTGAAVPAAEGMRIALQRRWIATGEPWRTVARTRTGEDGTFSFAPGFRSAGPVALRVIAHMPGRARSYSNELAYTIAQAQNSALTIGAATDPLPAGESTTVSGVLASGAGHAVLLLARTGGQRYQAVGSVQSGEGGTYSFTVAPTVNTIYRVRAGTVGSTPLFLGVLPKLSLSTLPAGVTRGSSVSFEGTSVGAPAGAPVRLETERDGGRSVVLTSGTLQPDGSFVLPFTFPRAGTYTLRIRVPAGRDTLSASSESFTTIVADPGA